jgi:hypothetical protein
MSVEQRKKLPMAAAFFACGPSSAKCKCHCPESCEHVWDGPTMPLPDGNGETATCSRCGEWAIHHDLWVCP